MGENGYNVFTFTCGGFFDGWDELRIEDRDGTHIASLVDRRGGDVLYERELSKEEMRSFEDFLQRAGVPKWFCHYNDWHVLDGTQWEMKYCGIEHSGSNAYPEGFIALTDYLADHFGCECFRCEDILEYSEEEKSDTWSPYPTPLFHIAEYANYVGDPEPNPNALCGGLPSPDDIEEEHRRNIEVADQLRHDFDILVGIEPKYVGYMEIVEKAGVPMGSKAMIGFDVSKLGAETIVAMMIFIYREDRFCGYQERFLECVEDGTFKRWLDRLSDLIGKDRL